MLEKTYDPKSIEQSTYEQWESAEYFKPSNQGQPYCIMLPPPNVTGSLHMGHGFQDVIMDSLIRYHRMCGLNTLWQPGMDHAGIATQMVVERKLLAEGTSRLDIGREAFVEKVWEWKEQSGGMILKQLRRLGTSLDWSRSRFTMDDELSKAVQKVFIELFDEGLIYRGKRLVNWDTKFHTAISDLEVVSEEEAGSLWYVKYPLSDGSGFITIATTRPETILGDTAIAVHPEDDRFKNLIGKTAQLPLCDREIPIIADEYVEPEFGTGCVKITPAHDFNDYEVGKRHGLPMINIFTADAEINENGPKAYQGLDRFDARKKIVEDLKAQELLVKTEDYTVKIPRGDRSKTVIEPWLTYQWFVKTKPLAEPSIQAVENGEIKFFPENWTKTYYQWMYNIQDWCISRQLWWGHRIPAWYNEEGNIYVAKDEANVREKYHLTSDIKLTQDEDVLDTWFSSALWPFSTLGWPNQTKELETFYPTSVLVTGFDIIFFWVARMIMFGLKFTGKIPFHEVYIHGLIRDAEGQKMSKSKGNVLDPIDLIDGVSLDQLIEKRTYGLMQPDMAAKITTATQKQFPDGIRSHGADALRLTYCALATMSKDIRFDMSRLEGNRNFCNKLWNATRYVLMQVENLEMKDLHFDQNNLSLPDRWIQSRLQKTIQIAHEHFKTYRFDLLAQTLYDFTWHEFCDWYLELSKPILTDPEMDQEHKAATLACLVSTLETLLRLMHPLMPFITEHLWQNVAPLIGIHEKSLMVQAYPQFDDSRMDETAEQDLEWVRNVILGIRNIRGEMNIAPSKQLAIFFHNGSSDDKQRLDKYSVFMQKLAKLESITWLQSDQPVPESAMALVGEMEILIPLAGLIDIEAETSRLTKEINKLQKDRDSCATKLQNPNFVNKAPQAIVETEQKRLAELDSAIQQLQQQLSKLKTV